MANTQRLLRTVRLIRDDLRVGNHKIARERAVQEVSLWRMAVMCPLLGVYHDLRGVRRDPRSTPVIINNYNRHGCLLELIAWLEKVGMRNIHILDNDSSYPPLLRFYDETPYRVIKLGRNVGSTALWDTPVWNEFKNDYYIYTDPDVVPWEQCPDDFIDFFYRTLDAQPEIRKVGFGLKIDDLPDHYAHKQKVVEWESRFWQQPFGDRLYRARVDTTFALYRPRAEGGHWCEAVRTAAPYVARHLPWYADSGNMSDEDLFYARAATELTHWTRARD